MKGIDIEVSEVGLRDGLQSIGQIMPTEAKKRWIKALALAGVPEIEVGTFVPGTGQEIFFRDQLLEEPVDVILIATQWRAADIVLEIQRNQIRFETILIEYQGQLIDYFQDAHPYREEEPQSTSSVPRPQFLSQKSRQRDSIDIDLE